MHHVRIRPTLRLLAWGIVSILAGCNSPGTGKGNETGAAIGTDSAAATAEASSEKGKIPLTTKSEDAKTLYGRGLALADQLRAHDAYQLFKQAVAKDPDFAMAHYQLALNAPTAKEVQTHVNRAAALSRGVSEGERLAILGFQAGVNGDPAKSLDYAKQAVAKYPDDERAHTALGNAYFFGQRDFQNARKELEKAIEIDSVFSPAYNMLGYSLTTLRDYPGAEKAFKKYIELVPHDPNPYDSYAELLMRTGRFDESIAQYRKALSIDRHFTGSHFGIASDLIFQGKHEQALAEAGKLQTAAQNDGGLRLAMFTRTLVYVDQGKTGAALKEMEKQYALGAKIGDTAAMAGDAHSIGDIELQTGNVQEASKRYQQALDMQVNSSLPDEAKEDAKLAHHYDVGRVALQKHDLATAKSEAAAYANGAEAKKSTFRVGQSHLLKGMIALSEKQFDQAAEELGKANQQDPFIVYQIALAQQGKGDQAKAKEAFRHAAEMYTLPTLNYVLIRSQAKKMAGSS
jgi:tetratricopeptide (TPR) repeat protein